MKLENWHTISYSKNSTRNNVLAEACAESGSPWFSGHFPGEPVLPGIAILSMVKDVIRQHEERRGKKIRIAEIKKVRFKLPVSPDERLKISIVIKEQEAGILYNFFVELDKKMICTGVAEAEPFTE